MQKSREIKNAKGEYILLERPEYNPSVLIRGGKVVNEEGYKLFLERQKQDKYVPTQADREEARAKAEKAEKVINSRLEDKVDKLADTVAKLAEIVAKQNG